MTANQCPLDLITLEVPLNEWPMGLLDEEPVDFPEGPEAMSVTLRMAETRRHVLD